MNTLSECGHSIRRAGLCPNQNGRLSKSQWSITLLVSAAVLALPGIATAQGSCTLGDTVLACTGDFPDGVIVVVGPLDPPITELALNGITSDIDVIDQPGVYMLNTSGGRVTVNAGAPGDSFLVNVAGDSTSSNPVFGIGGVSVGGPAAYVPLPSLGILVPVGYAGVGGAVDANNFADVATSGNGAGGLYAVNQVGTYPQAVIDSLENFDAESVTYEVVLVAGDAANIGEVISGSNGGTFLINANGSYAFDPGTDFDELALEEGDEARTSIAYFVNANLLPFGEGELSVIYYLNAETGEIESRFEVDYPAWGVGADETDSVFPDTQSFVDSLLADAGVAGTSAAVSVLNEGSVTTTGDGAHSIYVQTISGTGRAGKDSCTFCSSPSAGGPGADGGTVSVENNGTIETTGDGAAGIVATSRGGTGGQGGYGGPWYYGRSGGEGGRGGDLIVTGDGSIVTDGFRSSGIIATSEGGIGGNGGSGSGSTGGGRGGPGGDAGNIAIDSEMTITTLGDESHGIWARSIGGSGGTGGSAGWLGTASGGSGGNASDGGEVGIRNGGAITTEGLFS